MNKKKYHCSIAVLLIISLLIPISTVAVNAAEDSVQIRVGLTQFYEQKQAIRIKNLKIGIGYSVGDSFFHEYSLTSKTGYFLQSETRSFYILKQTYTSYSQAKKISDQLRLLNVASYPVIYQKNSYKVYIGAGTNQTLGEVKQLLDQQYGSVYTGPSIDNGHRIRVTASNDVFLMDGEGANGYPQIRSEELNEDKVPVVNLGARQYRGRIEIGRYGFDKLSAINIVNLESYLFSVVAGEMTSSWPMESLKAQAVCSRSYAYAKAGITSDSDRSKPYRLKDTTQDQVYKGWSVETSRSVFAVRQTANEMVTYQGKVVTTYYFSTSGGRTENSLYVWGNSTPYLKSVVDSYEMSPELAPWLLVMTKSELKSYLKKAGLDVGDVISVIPEIYTESQRVYQLKIVGTKKTIQIKGEKVRTIFGLYSTKFNVINNTDNADEVSVLSANGISKKNLSKCYALNSSNQTTYLSDTSNNLMVVKGSDNQKSYSKTKPGSDTTIYFAGMGYGHGVGMSQSGAKGMAEEGYTYKDIICYYFKGVRVVSI